MYCQLKKKQAKLQSKKKKMAFGTSIRLEYECAWLDQVYSLQLIRFTHAGELLVSTRHFYVYPRTTPKTDQKMTKKKIKASNSSHTHWITYPNNNDRTNFIRIRSRRKNFDHVRVYTKNSYTKGFFSRLVSSRRKSHVASLLLDLLCLFAFFVLLRHSSYFRRSRFLILFVWRSCNRDRQFFFVRSSLHILYASIISIEQMRTQHIQSKCILCRKSDSMKSGHKSCI